MRNITTGNNMEENTGLKNTNVVKGNIAVIEQIDSTILALCNCIQKQINAPSISENNYFLPEMTKALAKLIVARAEM